MFVLDKGWDSGYIHGKPRIFMFSVQLLHHTSCWNSEYQSTKGEWRYGPGPATEVTYLGLIFQ